MTVFLIQPLRWSHSVFVDVSVCLNLSSLLAIFQFISFVYIESIISLLIRSLTFLIVCFFLSEFFFFILCDLFMRAYIVMCLLMLN